MSTQPDKTLGQIVAEIPKAREGWIVEHPASGKPVEVVTREDYDWLYNYAAKIIDSVAQAQPVKSLEEIARKAAKTLHVWQPESDPDNEYGVHVYRIILRACQAATRANRE